MKSLLIPDDGELLNVVPKPANEGWVDRIKSVFGGRRAATPVKFDAGRAHLKMQDFINNPNAYIFTGKKFSEADKLYLSIDGRPPMLSHMARVLERTLHDAAILGVKFHKDAAAHRRLCVPLIERFEKTMIDNMDQQGNIDPAILNRAMEPLLAAVPKAKASYYYQFVQKDYLACGSWLGGKPFNYEMKTYKGHQYLDDAERDPPTAVPAANDLNAFTKLVQVLLDNLEDSHPVWKDDRLLHDDEHWVSYEFDRPVRHLWEEMNEIQQQAISAIYSHESNTESLSISLEYELDRVLNSLLHYINESIVKK